MDIALRAVFDLVPQHIHSLNRDLPLWLVDGSQLNTGQRRGGNVIKADQADLAGDINVPLVRRPQDT